MARQRPGVRRPSAAPAPQGGSEKTAAANQWRAEVRVIRPRRFHAAATEILSLFIGGRNHLQIQIAPPHHPGGHDRFENVLFP